MSTLIELDVQSALLALNSSSTLCRKHSKTNLTSRKTGLGTARINNETLSRREAVIINRLRLGHCHLTHSHLMSGDDQPVFQSCRLALTLHLSVIGLLVDYPDWQGTRLRAGGGSLSFPL